MNKNSHWKAKIIRRRHFSIKFSFLKDLLYVNEIWKAEDSRNAEDSKISLIWEAAFFWKDTALLEEQYRETLLAVNRKDMHRAFRIGPLKGGPIKGLDTLMRMNHWKDFC